MENHHAINGKTHKVSMAMASIAHCRESLNGLDRNYGYLRCCHFRGIELCFVGLMYAASRWFGLFSWIATNRRDFFQAHFPFFLVARGEIPNSWGFLSYVEPQAIIQILLSFFSIFKIHKVQHWLWVDHCDMIRKNNEHEIYWDIVQLDIMGHICFWRWCLVH